MPTLSPLPNRSPSHQGLAWMQTLLDAFSEPPNGPDGPLLRERELARRALETAGMPGRKEEAWRFTDLSLLQQIAPGPIVIGAKPTDTLPTPASHPWRLPLTSWPRADEASWPSGVEPLMGPDLDAHLGVALAATDTAAHWTVLLNSAIVQHVVALRIRPGVRRCLELVSDTAQAAGVLPHRILVVLEEGASLELLQVHQASGPSLTSVVVEAHLAKEATLQHALITQGGPSSALLALTAVCQAPGSHYDHTSLSTGWGMSRQDPVILQGAGQAITQLRGLHWVRESQIADTHSRVRFAGPDGKLDQVHKVVAEDAGRSVFNGCIQVPRLAQRTDAAQLSRSLLLSDRARIDTKPELEIVADDVRCTHGATISRLQEDELFYLRTRGIGADQASRLLLRSFCDEVVASLPHAAKAWNPLAPLLEEKSQP